MFAGDFLCPSDWLRQKYADRGKRPAQIAAELGLPPNLVMIQLIRALLLPPLRPSARPAEAGPAVALDDSQKAAATWVGGPLLVDGRPGHGQDEDSGSPDSAPACERGRPRFDPRADVLEEGRRGDEGTAVGDGQPGRHRDVGRNLSLLRNGGRNEMGDPRRSHGQGPRPRPDRLVGPTGGQPHPAPAAALPEPVRARLRPCAHPADDADAFFPGTSTIQTRARYFLFVSWVYRELEKKRVPSEKVRDRARRARWPPSSRC